MHLKPASYRQQNFYLADRSRALAATLIAPGDGTASGIMLIVPPFFEERKALVLPFVELMRKLALTCGIASLKIDLSCTGDSDGDCADASIERHLSEIGVAAAWLRALAPGAPFFILGARCGGALASRAAKTLPTPDALVLWDAISGAEAIRQWLQRHMVNEMLAYGKARSSREELLRRLENGETIDLDGFPLTSAFHAALRATPLVASALPTLALVSGRPSRELLDFSTSFPEVILQRLNLPAYWNSVGYIDTSELADATDKFLSRFLTAQRTTLADSGTVSTSSVHGEHVVEIPSAGHLIRAIISQSTVPAPSGSRPIVFLGGWSGDRQGPHRLFVSFARRLAKAGIPSVRFDYSGRGESDLAHDQAGIETMTCDTLDVIGFLKKSCLGEREFDVVAICSGCKVAITAAATSGSLRNLVLWSAEPMGSLRPSGATTHKRLFTLGIYLKKLLKRETWRKIFKGNLNARLVGKALARQETRTRDEAHNEDKALAKFKTFSGFVSFIYGTSDPDAKGAENAYKRFCAKNHIRADFASIESAGHSFYGIDWTDQLLRLTENALTRCAQEDKPPRYPS